MVMIGVFNGEEVCWNTSRQAVPATSKNVITRSAIPSFLFRSYTAYTYKALVNSAEKRRNMLTRNIKMTKKILLDTEKFIIA